MQPAQIIDTVPLFEPLSRGLVDCLASLSPDEWSLPTACALWTVKDLAAHLLGGSLGRLWPPRAGNSVNALEYGELLALINASNADWVRAARRISPQMLIELLTLADTRLQAHFAALDPLAPAGPAVLWAGETQSANWFDIAREYTEKWLHQQHIRDATGRPLLTSRALCHAVHDTFLRGLPHAYRGIDAPDNVTVTVRIAGEAGGDWTLLRHVGNWRLMSGTPARANAAITLDQDTAWRVFTKGLPIDAALARAHLVGDRTLAARTLALVAIMA